MDIKQFVEQNSLEYVKSFLTTLRDLEETNGKQVRDIEYFIRLREAEEAQLKAEKDLADRFALQLQIHGRFILANANVDNEVVISFGEVKYIVKVLSKV